MKTLSVRQPWSNLIVHNIKPIENRTWHTKFRGRVLIHAPAKNDMKDIIFTPEQEAEILTIGIFAATMETSAIIGSVEIVDCVQNHDSIWAEKDSWNWVLANPVLFKDPILNVKGKLSFWEYEGEINEMS